MYGFEKQKHCCYLLGYDDENSWKHLKTIVFLNTFTHFHNWYQLTIFVKSSATSILQGYSNHFPDTIEGRVPD